MEKSPADPAVGKLFCFQESAELLQIQKIIPHIDNPVSKSAVYVQIADKTVRGLGQKRCL